MESNQNTTVRQVLKRLIDRSMVRFTVFIVTFILALFILVLIAET